MASMAGTSDRSDQMKSTAGPVSDKLRVRRSIGAHTCNAPTRIGLYRDKKKLRATWPELQLVYVNRCFVVMLVSATVTSGDGAWL